MYSNIQNRMGPGIQIMVPFLQAFVNIVNVIEKFTCFRILTLCYISLNKKCFTNDVHGLYLEGAGWNRSERPLHILDLQNLMVISF